MLADGIYRVVARIKTIEVHEELIVDENEAKRRFCKLVNSPDQRWTYLGLEKYHAFWRHAGGSWQKKFVAKPGSEGRMVVQE